MRAKRIEPFRARIAVGVALTLLAAVVGLAAETNVPLKPAAWRQVGPGPGAIEAAIAVDAPSGTIYIASLGGGVLKSTNGGASFVPVNNGLDDLVVATMAMAPGDPNVVYAGTGVGVYKTIDGGATWSATQAADIPIALVIAPTDANVLYAGYNGSISKTTDGGATWLSIGDSLGAPQVFSLAVDPRDSNVVYAGTTGQGAFQSLDGGATWNAADDRLDGVVSRGRSGRRRRHLRGLQRQRRLQEHRPGCDVRAHRIARGRRRLCAREERRPALRGHRLAGGVGQRGRRSHVDEHRHLREPRPRAQRGCRGGGLCGTNFDGVFQLPADRAAAGDASARRHEWRRLAWKQLKDCYCQNGHAITVDPSDSRHVFLSTNDGGLLVTDDGGRTWKDGGTHGFVARAPRGIAFDPREPRRVYAGSFTGGGLFKSEDHGRHWQRRLFGPDTLYVTGIAVDPVDQTIYAGTLFTGIWKSTDFGDTFTRIDRAPGADPGVFLGLKGRGIVIDSHHHRTLYFAGRNSGVWRSQDAGASWIKVDSTPVLTVTVDPVDSSVVYAGGASGVLKSVDGGDSFVPKNDGLPDAVVTRTGFIQVQPNHHNVVYVGFEGAGVYRSSNGGETWAAVNSGLDDPNVYGLAMDPDSPNTLYASTSSSVFKTTTGGQ